MGRNSRGRIPQSREQVSRQRLANLETSETEAFGNPDSGATPTNLRLPGEKVATPSSDLMGHSTDWGKIGVYVGIAAFILPAIFGGAWFFSDMNSSIRGVVDEVKDLKRKSDDLFRQSADSMARISVLERFPTNTEKSKSDKKN